LANPDRQPLMIPGLVVGPTGPAVAAPPKEFALRESLNGRVFTRQELYELVGATTHEAQGANLA